jgi:hypothetical protein
MKGEMAFDYLISVEVSATVLPDLNCTGFSPMLYKANALILNKVLLVPVTGFSPFIVSSNLIVNKA